MKINFIQKILGQPWDIERARGRVILSSMIQRLRSERPAEDIFGDPLPKMEIIGDVAYVPICGTLILNVPDWAKSYGLSVTDPNDIAEELRQANDDTRVSFIALNWDSPGGESAAGNKLFDLVSALRKPVLSYSADGAMICSAAFNGALPSTRIYTGPYATVGSVGSYLAYLDDTEFWKMMGITVEVFRSGEIKGIGEDALTDPQREFLQTMVDRAGKRFRGNVQSYRSLIDEADLQGQWFDGDDAAARSFTHGIAPDLATAVQRFRTQL